MLMGKEQEVKAECLILNRLNKTIYTLDNNSFSLYHWDHTTGSDAIIHSHRTHIIRVLAPSQKVLASHELVRIVDHEATAFHSDGVTVIEDGMQVSAVTHALMITAAEVPILVKDNLEETFT